MKQIRSFGTLLPTYSLSEQVSVSTDTVQYDPSCKYKVYVQLEPPEVLGSNVQNIIAHQNNFDLILAWHKDILNNCSKSKRFIFGSCWIDIKNFISEKQNEVSFLMSNKGFAPGHMFRHQVYKKLNGVEKINGFKIRSIMTPPRIETKDIVFKHAKFSIIIENAVHENWITEKFIDCVATKTIPIYYGAPNIGDFFNEKGILKFNTIEELNNILNTITPQTYDELSEVIEENYNKSFQYFDFHERVQEEINIFIKSHS